jgi:hypothetical protein
VCCLLVDRYVSILPSIHLSAKVSAETVIKLRHPLEQGPVKVKQPESYLQGHSEKEDPSGEAKQVQSIHN